MDEGMPASVTAFAHAIAVVDAILIVTPEYNWSVPGTLKNAIDWISRLRPNPLEDKPVAIWSVNPGKLGGARLHESMRQILHSQGMLIMAKPEVQSPASKARLTSRPTHLPTPRPKLFLNSISRPLTLSVGNGEANDQEASKPWKFRSIPSDGLKLSGVLHVPAGHKQVKSCQPLLSCMVL